MDKFSGKATQLFSVLPSFSMVFNSFKRMNLLPIWENSSDYEKNHVGMTVVQDGWLVGCFGINGPLRQYFSLYRAVSQREGRKKREMIDERKNVQTSPIRTYCKRSKLLPYYDPN